MLNNDTIKNILNNKITSCHLKFSEYCLIFTQHTLSILMSQNSKMGGASKLGTLTRGGLLPQENCLCTTMCRMFIKSVCEPDDIQRDVCVVEFSIYTVVVQGDDVVQLRDGDVDIRVVGGVQGDATDADTVRKEQVRLGHFLTGAPVALQQDSCGTCTGRPVRPWQAQVRTAPISPSTLVKA